MRLAEKGFDQLIVYRGIDSKCIVPQSADPNPFRGTAGILDPGRGRSRLCIDL